MIADSLDGLRAEYAKAIKDGNLQLAAEMMQRINALLAETGGNSQAAAQQVTEAFQRLGVTSSAELNNLATSARADFETIRDHGESTSRDMQSAWLAWAQKAIQANGGIIPSTVANEGTLYNVAVAADASGKAILKAMNDAASATEGTIAVNSRLQAQYDAIDYRIAHAGQRATDSGNGLSSTRSTNAGASLSSDQPAYSGSSGRSESRGEDSVSYGGFGVPDDAKWCLTYNGIYDFAKNKGLPTEIAAAVAKEWENKAPLWVGHSIKEARPWIGPGTPGIDKAFFHKSVMVAAAVDEMLAALRRGRSAYFGRYGSAAVQATSAYINSSTTTGGTQNGTQDVTTTGQGGGAGVSPAVSGHRGTRTAESTVVHRIDLNYQGRQVSIRTTDPAAPAAVADWLTAIERDMRSAS